jgi:hypothetical protein
LSRLPQQPLYPADLAAFVTPALAPGLTALEWGVVYRLTSACWRLSPPGSLPAGDALLAMVAGCTSEEWARVGPRVLLAMNASGATPDGRIELGLVRMAYERLLQVAERQRQQTSAATQARLSRSAQATKASVVTADTQRGGTSPVRAQPTARPPDPPGDSARHEHVTSTSRAHHEHVTSTSRAVAQNRRFSVAQNSEETALLLERSNQSANPSAQDPMQSEKEVLALVGAGARALMQDRISTWRRTKAQRMLEEAIARWQAMGVTDCPTTKAAELARSEHATPARIQHLIETAHAKLAHGTKAVRPIGWLIHGLGVSSKNPGQPREVPMWLEQDWQKREAEAIRMLEIQASIDAKRRQFIEGGADVGSARRTSRG